MAARELSELLRRTKYAIVRRRSYERWYQSLSPVGYTRAWFQAESSRARRDYVELDASIGAEAIDEFDSVYCHPYWTASKTRFARTLVRGLPEAFLDDPILRPNMVRRGWAEPQRHEEAYLKSRPEELRSWIKRFRESRVGGPFLECESLRCSATSLGHLYYAARIAEAFPDLTRREHAVVEFGGGYGSFARAYQLLAGTGPYVIIDFPEFLAVQQLYLRLNGVECVIVKAPGSIAPGSGVVTLLPVYFLAETDLTGDLFVSHFALSETPAALQQLVAQRRFFDCDALYLTGQYAGMQQGHAWVSHQKLHDAIKAQYVSTRIEDFLPAWGYEVVARRSLGQGMHPLAPAI